MNQYFLYRATSLKRRINLGLVNRRFILRLRDSFDEPAFVGLLEILLLWVWSPDLSGSIKGERLAPTGNLIKRYMLRLQKN